LKQESVYQAGYVIEASNTPSGPWSVVATGFGARIEETFVHAIESAQTRFFRLRRN
jgi:hypothetical protein